jgi:hypothetical protein
MRTLTTVAEARVAGPYGQATAVWAAATCDHRGHEDSYVKQRQE